MIKSLPHLNLWPEAERQEIFSLSVSEKGLHVVHDEFEVVVVVQELDVLVNVLVTSIVSPDVNKLVLITNQDTEVAKTFSMQHILVGIYESFEIQQQVLRTIVLDNLTLEDFLVLEIFINGVWLDRVRVDLYYSLFLCKLVGV